MIQQKILFNTTYIHSVVMKTKNIEKRDQQVERDFERSTERIRGKIN